MKMVFDMMV